MAERHARLQTAIGEPEHAAVDRQGGYKLPLASRSMLLWIGKASLTLFRFALQQLDLKPM